MNAQKHTHTHADADATAGPPAAPELQPGAQIRQACSQLGLAISDAQNQQLLAYLDLLQRWNKVYNLTGLRHPADMLTHHLLDCLATLPALTNHIQAQSLAKPQLLDVGSGGGLPGVVLAIMAPHWQVHCVDAVGKKAGFIRQVAAELRLAGLQGLHSRVERLQAPGSGYDVIVSRAFASLADFSTLTHQLLSPNGSWAAMKGKPSADELHSLPPGVEVFHVEQLQVPLLAVERCIVWMKCRNTSAGNCNAADAPRNRPVHTP